MINCDINCDTVELLDFDVAQIVGILGKPPTPSLPDKFKSSTKNKFGKSFLSETKNRQNHEITSPPKSKNHTIHKN